MFRYIFTRAFLLNVLAAAVLIAACIGGAYYYLKKFTRSDEIVEVPDLSEYDLVEAEAMMKNSRLSVVVIDSLYLPGMRGGQIVDQQPPAGAKVKPDRKIYLTIARYSVPKVMVPNVLDQGLPIAIAKLESYGFKIGSLKAQPAECKDCVISMSINGEALNPGDKLPKGSRIDLVIGEGKTGARTTVPLLSGLTVEEAKELLLMHNLNLGAVRYDDCSTSTDSATAQVYWQSNQPSEKISSGSSVYVYVSCDREKIPEVNLDSIKSLLR
ncbi:MAG: hypothetical protein Kow0075_04730 [Salibacteraceae bacterium]